MSTNAMAMCLGENYTNITTITMEDARKSAEMINLFMDKDVEPRKKYILEHFEEIGGNLD